MSVIIRSQDGTKIINLATVNTILMENSKDKYIIEYYVNGNYEGDIALYTTKEKAIKVLDMIQEAYCGMRSVDCTTRGMLDTFAKREDVSCLLDLHIDKYFFQMPKDSEV